MKRRETKRVWEDVGLSPLVRAGARWLSFARGLSRGARCRTAAADPLAFIESLYGRKFTAVEGRAFDFDKVYRTAGGGLFVSETRLNLSVHPKFDLSLLNVVGGGAGSQFFKETTLLSHTVTGGREHLSSHTSEAVAGTSLTVQTWNVSPAMVERVPPAFGYVHLRGQRAQPAQGFEPLRFAARGDLTTSPTLETWRSAVAPSPASIRTTGLDLLASVIHSPRQAFVSLLLNTYLPAVVSREILSVTTKRGLSNTTKERAAAQGETPLRFTPAPGTRGRRPAAWTYAGPGVAAEIHRESRSLETLQGLATAHDSRPSLLQVLPPTSLRSSPSGTSLTLLAGGAGQTTFQLDRFASALSLQLVRTHRARPGTREASASVYAPRLLARTAPPLQTGAREALSSLSKFVRHVYSFIDGNTYTGRPTLYARPGFEAAPRRGFERVLIQPRAAASDAAPKHATSSVLFNRTFEFVRLTSTSEFGVEAPAHDAGTQVLSKVAQPFFSTQGAPGAGTFIFTRELLRRTTRASKAGALTPTAATALRLVAAAETERALRETRAARPEGMALELVRQRREEVLQLPKPGYVYTQPARAQLEERQVITKASRAEIVEVVRREVRSLTSNAPAPAAPTRADLAGIADEVYTTLVRRLLIEKERLGRF
ncbi:MAG: hypothetical protein ACJ754_02330 [Pyrinomonadaceae bacterium]